MTDKTLFTAQHPVEKISERTLYLTSLSVELYSYGISHSMHVHLKWPTKLAFKYLVYNGTYLKRFQTSLRNFDNKEIKFFKTNKSSLLDNFEKDLEESIDKAIDVITKLVFKKKRKISDRAEIPIKINCDVNKHVHQDIKDLINHIHRASMGQDVTFHIPAIPKTSIDTIENRIIEIGEKALVIKAFLHAEERANFNGKKYNYKKLVRNIDEIYKDLMFDKKTGEIKSDLLEKKISEICNDVVDTYEVIGKTDYLLNESKFKSAIEGNFKSKIENFKKTKTK